MCYAQCQRQRKESACILWQPSLQTNLILQEQIIIYIEHGTIFWYVNYQKFSPQNASNKSAPSIMCFLPCCQLPGPVSPSNFILMFRPKYSLAKFDISLHRKPPSTPISAETSISRLQSANRLERAFC